MDEEQDVDGFDGWTQSGMQVQQRVVSLDSDDEVIDLDELDLDTVEPEVSQAPSLASRTYDISICYDNYYNVPHVYMVGRDLKLQPLTLEQMYEDISADHKDKTVTYENHPFLSGQYLSIHPCQHGHIMVTFIQQLENPATFCAPAYYFLFLKFIHSVVPTIDIATPTLALA
jgi:ubiquitin-like-conjugating enzyme ATG3